MPNNSLYEWKLLYLVYSLFKFKRELEKLPIACFRCLSSCPVLGEKWSKIMLDKVDEAEVGADEKYTELKGFAQQKIMLTG